MNSKKLKPVKKTLLGNIRVPIFLRKKKTKQITREDLSTKQDQLVEKENNDEITGSLITQNKSEGIFFRKGSSFKKENEERNTKQKRNISPVPRMSRPFQVRDVKFVVKTANQATKLASAFIRKLTIGLLTIFAFVLLVAAAISMYYGRFNYFKNFFFFLICF